jgi:hypothetical protein
MRSKVRIARGESINLRWLPISDLVDEWRRKLPPELHDPAIRFATEAVNQRAAGPQARA